MGKKAMTDLLVSDSGPLITFARADKLHIVKNVYGEIIIPQEVYDEIVIRGKGKPGAEEVKGAAWISVQKPKNQNEVVRLKKKFHLGESEAVVLAKELIATLLADEWVVIKEARRQGIEITSTHLTLEVAKTRGLIRSLKKELEELISTGFRTTEELREMVIANVPFYGDS